MKIEVIDLPPDTKYHELIDALRTLPDGKCIKVPRQEFGQRERASVHSALRVMCIKYLGRSIRFRHVGEDYLISLSNEKIGEKVPV